MIDLLKNLSKKLSSEANLLASKTPYQPNDSAKLKLSIEANRKQIFASILIDKACNIAIAENSGAAYPTGFYKSVSQSESLAILKQVIAE